MDERAPEPKIDHGAHLFRLTLELCQLVALFGCVVLLVKTGVNAKTGAALAVAGILTILLIRTPRPPLPGNDR